MGDEHAELAERIEAGLDQANKLVEEFKDAWSRGHLVDAGGLQVKLLSWRKEKNREEVRQLRFVLGGQLVTAEVTAEDDLLASIEGDPTGFIVERAVSMAAESFRQLLLDAICEATASGQLTR